MASFTLSFLILPEPQVTLESFSLVLLGKLNYSCVKLVVCGLLHALYNHCITLRLYSKSPVKLEIATSFQESIGWMPSLSYQFYQITRKKDKETQNTFMEEELMQKRSVLNNTKKGVLFDSDKRVSRLKGSLCWGCTLGGQWPIRPKEDSDVRMKPLKLK